MQTTSYNTAHCPPLQRGAFWLDEVCARHLGVFGRTHMCADHRFFGQMQRISGHGFVATTLACTAGEAYRRPADVQRISHNNVVISIERGSGALWRQGGRELKLRHGDILVTSPDDPYVMSTLGDFDLASFYIPRAMLAGHHFPGDMELPRVLPARDPAGGLASGFGNNLLSTMPQLDPTTAAAMLDSFVRLVAVAAGAAAPLHGQALREARLDQALRHLDQHLSDQALSPASCARALGISVRSLHLIFEPTGASFAQTLLRRRLERCHAALANPTLAGRPVSDIAFAAGFGSLAGFYRAFTRAYCAAPSDIRTASAA